jgi:hypothetical protein
MKYIIISAFIFLQTNNILKAQCSDAGICMIGKRQSIEDTRFSNVLGLRYIFGTGGSTTTGDHRDNDITYHQLHMDVELEPFTSSRLNIDVPLQYATGPLGNASGIGDIMFLWSQLFGIQGGHNITLSAGVKIPSGKSDLGDSLVQSYQPGLGSIDLLFGLGYSLRSFYVAAGYQKTLGESRNFTKFKKGDDLLFRAGWSQQFNKMNIKAEVLTIKRLNKSKMLLIPSPVPLIETITEIEDSDFLQVNILGQVTYNLRNDLKINGFAAFPLLQREENSDGTRRAFTIGAGVNYFYNY